MAHRGWLSSFHQWHERHTWACCSAYMRGWDASLMATPDMPRNNPYARREFRAEWDKGYTDCMAGKALPRWYSEWWRRCGRRAQTAQEAE